MRVGAYYFPNYHVDARNEIVHGPGWSEWNLVQAARPRFAGHRQPRVPLWGYTDEADPREMERKIGAAADHGVDFWIFDWYWYDDGPFLQRALDEGYLAARNNDRVQFCCMWANHDWKNIHPAKLRDPHSVLYPGKITPETFVAATNRVIERYFSHPSHFRIDGKPYFSFYDISKLVESFGGVAQARLGLDSFRERASAAGLSGLHLNAVVWGQRILPGESEPAEWPALLRDLGFDSFSSYVWIHHARMPKFPQTDYTWARDRYFQYWGQIEHEIQLPYWPNVTMGWDPSPRTVSSDAYLNVGYPFTPTLEGNTPEAFCEALRLAKQRLEARPPAERILTINAWNEWTEGSYLEPDETNGMGYLEAIRTAFRA